MKILILTALALLTAKVAFSFYIQRPAAHLIKTRDLSSRKSIHSASNSNTVAAMDSARIIPLELTSELQRSFLAYASSTILDRALPDVRDGLKPVQRRILYAMHELKLFSDSYSRDLADEMWAPPKLVNRSAESTTPISDSPSGGGFRKCARVVGEVLGKYHPHGDVSVYEALVRMAQQFVMLHPLVNGHGNFGSVDGDPAAAMRYTEAKLTHVAFDALLADLSYNAVNKLQQQHQLGNSSSQSRGESVCVDYQLNFDGNEVEPLVLPAKLPMVLLNGAQGIAVGMATSIPPHNLAELCAGLIALIDNPDITLEELMKYVPGPDFPTGGFLIDESKTNGRRELYSSGKGSFVLQARYHHELLSAKGETMSLFDPFEEANTMSSKPVSKRSTVKGQGKLEKGTRNAIVVTELPYRTNKAALMEELAKLVSDKKLEGVSDLRDESDQQGIRIVIELKNNVAAESVEAKLFPHTMATLTSSAAPTTNVNDQNSRQRRNKFARAATALHSGLHSSFSGNMLVLANSGQGPTPMTLGLKQILAQFVNFRFETLRRIAQIKHQKAAQRMHVVEGLLVALQSIDKVIELIRASKDTSDSKATLRTHFNLSDIQVDAITSLRLARLTTLEVSKLREEKQELSITLAHLLHCLNNDTAINSIMKSEISHLSKRHRKERRTRFWPSHLTVAAAADAADGVKPPLETGAFEGQPSTKKFVVCVTHGKYLHRLKAGDLKAQNRSTVMKPRLKLAKLSGMKQSSDAATPSGNEEDAVCAMQACNENDVIMLVTKSGQVYGIPTHQVPVSEGGSTAAKSRGTAVKQLIPTFGNAENLDAKASVVDSSGSDVSALFALPHDPAALSNSRLVVVTQKGIVKKISAQEVLDSVTAKGLKLIDLHEGDTVAAVALAPPQSEDSQQLLLLATSLGLAKTVNIKSLPTNKRSARGKSCVDLLPNDSVVGGEMLGSRRNDSMALFVTDKGHGLLVKADELIRGTSSATSSSESKRGKVAFKLFSHSPYKLFKNKKNTTASIPRASRGLVTSLAVVSSAGLEDSEDNEPSCIVLGSEGGKVCKMRISDIPLHTVGNSGVRLVRISSDKADVEGSGQVEQEVPGGLDEEEGDSGDDTDSVESDRIRFLQVVAA